MKQIGVFGAFDRYNVGDILFAEIANKYVQNPIYFSPTGRYLEHRGGPRSLPSKSITADLNGLVFAGGEVLSADWFDVWASLQSATSELLIQLTSKIFSKVILNELAHARINNEWNSPYMLPAFLSNVPTAYISVGGLIDEITNKNIFRNSIQALHRARYISTRDSQSNIQLMRQGLKCYLAPDSVATLALHHIPTDSSVRNEYILIQSSLNWIKRGRNLELLENFLRYLVKSGLDTKFIVAGETAMHSDFLSYKVLKKRIPNLELVNANTPELFKKQIANSTLLVGTSLHSHIVATAFCIPSIKLYGVPKLDRYLETWCPWILELNQFTEDFEALVQNSLAFKQRLYEVSQTLATLASENYKKAISELVD